MRYLQSVCAALLCAVSVHAANWAVLVAGSNGYWNYRHQADVCHAYQLLVQHGMPEENIITMFYDDIANDFSNPFPGRVFNRPSNSTHTDVYKNCKKSYTGDSVTAENFLNVLRGNVTGVNGGSGEVLRSTRADEVFVYYADHGGTGLIAMPTGPFLYADQLNETLNYMADQGMFDKLTFYMEACESGSMFDGILPSNIRVYATTAANSDESSWGTYCPPFDIVNGTHLNACLGDLYSVNWIQNAEIVNVAQETLDQQFVIVQNETNMSHVSRFGDMSFVNWTIGTFEGALPAPKGWNASYTEVTGNVHWDSRVASILSLQKLHESASGQHKQHLAATLDSMTYLHKKVDAAMHAITSTAGWNLDNVLATPVQVSDWECYKQATTAFFSDAHCGAHTDYTLRYAKAFAHMCRSYDLPTILTTIEASCSM